MEKGKGKYIKNTTDYAYALEVKFMGELSASLVKEFRPETMDGQSGKILHNGFTFVTNEEYEQLQNTQGSVVMLKKVFLLSMINFQMRLLHLMKNMQLY